jgi:F420-non-reducing hydrogenase iron-sulfur subunit
LEIDFFLKAFENGADGVIVAGCEEGSCHFKEGNLLARRRVDYTRELLNEIGLETERLRMVNIGAADARKFADVMKEMMETVRNLGPAPYKKARRPMSQETRT